VKQESLIRILLLLQGFLLRLANFIKLHVRFSGLAAGTNIVLENCVHPLCKTLSSSSSFSVNRFLKERLGRWEPFSQTLELAKISRRLANFIKLNVCFLALAAGTDIVLENRVHPL
jgi:hypothetical protein